MITLLVRFKIRQFNRRSLSGCRIGQTGCIVAIVNHVESKIILRCYGQPLNNKSLFFSWRQRSRWILNFLRGCCTPPGPVITNHIFRRNLTVPNDVPGRRSAAAAVITGGSPDQFHRSIINGMHNKVIDRVRINFFGLVAELHTKPLAIGIVEIGKFRRGFVFIKIVLSGNDVKIKLIFRIFPLIYSQTGHSVNRIIFILIIFNVIIKQRWQLTGIHGLVL